MSVYRITENYKQNKTFCYQTNDGEIMFTSPVPVDRKYLLILSELSKDRGNDMLEGRTENNNGIEQ